MTDQLCFLSRLPLHFTLQEACMAYRNDLLNEWRPGSQALLNANRHIYQFVLPYIHLDSWVCIQ